MSRIAAIGASIAVVAIMAIITSDAVLRGLTGASFGGAVEYAEILLVVAVALALGGAQREGAHVSVDFVLDRLPRRAAAAIRGAGYVLSFALLVWMLVRCTELAWHSFTTGEARFGLRLVPLWPARAAIVVGLALLTYEVGRQTVLDLRRALVGDRDAGDRGAGVTGKTGEG